MKFTSILIVLLFAFTLAACGGGGGSSRVPDPMPDVHPVMLPDKPMVEDGVDYTVPPVSIDEAVTIEAGGMQTIGYLTFTCATGGEACSIAQADDGSVTSTGGKAEAMVAESVTMDLQAAIDAKAEADRQAALRAQEHDVDISGLPGGYNMIKEGDYTLEAGESVDVGDAKFTCPAGDVGCNVSVTTMEVTLDDGTTGMVTMVTSMGGAVTVASSQAALDKIEMARLDELRGMMHEVDMTGIAEGYGPDEGMYDIAPGETGMAGNVDFSCPAASAVNCMVVVDAEGMVTNSGGAATAVQSETGMAAIDKDNEDARMAAAEVAAAAAEAKAKLIAAAIGPRDDDYMPPDADPSEAGAQLPFNLAAIVDDAAEFTENPATADPVTDDDFSMSSDDAPADLGGKWKGATYTRTMEDDDDMTMTTDMIVKYNNKEAPRNQDYDEYFTSDTISADTNGAGTAVESVTAETGMLALEESEIGGNHELFTGDFGITGPHQTIPSTPDDPATADVDESTAPQNVVGSFRGIAGVFSCTFASAGDCTRSSDKDGNLNALGGEWTFTPSGTATGGGVTSRELAALVVQGVVPDDDFMVFGYWLRDVTDEDGQTYAFTAFTDGKMEPADISGVEGTATYEGPATGLYMKKSLTPDGQPARPFNSGQFTADAELKASFGGDDVAANNKFSISGTISNFMDGNNPINDAWVVNLNRPEDDAATPDANESLNISDTAGTFDGETDGGPLGSAMGDWSGQFHGAIAEDDTTDVMEAKFAPNSATGIFEGHFSNGHVRGAFGVDKQ